MEGFGDSIDLAWAFKDWGDLNKVSGVGISVVWTEQGESTLWGRPSWPNPEIGS